MADFAFREDVEVLNPHHAYTSTSKPTDDQVEVYLDKANRDVTAELLAMGVPVTSASFTQSTYPQVWAHAKDWAAHKAAVLAERAHVAGGRTQGENTHLRSLIEERERVRKTAMTNAQARFAVSSVREMPYSNELDNPTALRVPRDKEF